MLTILPLLACAARAGDDAPLLPPILGTSERFLADWRSALALGGVDPVGYFVENAAQAGDPRFEGTWHGVTWRFTSAANRAAFADGPEGFAPRVGGYDALMAGRGAVVASDPTVFRIQAGRLYLFRSEANRRLFDADRTMAARAEAAWPQLRVGLNDE